MLWNGGSNIYHCLLVANVNSMEPSKQAFFHSSTASSWLLFTYLELRRLDEIF